MPYTESCRLLALDLDGTLLTGSGTITEASRAAIRAAQRAGIQVVPATGRDYDGIPWQELNGVQIDYAITTNGTSVYRTRDRACLYERCLPPALAAEVFGRLLHEGVYINVFSDGRAYVPRALFPLAEKLELPDYVRRGLLANRTAVDDLPDQLRSGALRVQKGTLNFWREETGALHGRDAVLAYLSGISGLTVVDGGFSNLEFTVHGSSKADGLRFLTRRLGLTTAQCAAIGDSENDAALLQCAGLGIAMGSAPADIRALADAVTASNAEDGVARAIHRFLLCEGTLAVG